MITGHDVHAGILVGPIEASSYPGAMRKMMKS